MSSTSWASTSAKAAYDPWFYRPTASRAASARLFCFPHAGVGASVYRKWATGLPAEFELCAVQLPGRTSRFSEKPIDSIPVLVNGIVEAITPFLDTPFAFFGHSMGAILAAEVARELAAKGAEPPGHLIVSARRPPHMADPQTPMRHLSDTEFVSEVTRRYGGIPPEILAEKEVLTMLLPALRADITALETYRPPRRKPLPCPISVFGGVDDLLAPRAHLDAWREETSSDFEVTVFPGGHFYLESERSAVLAKVSEILVRTLDQESSA